MRKRSRLPTNRELNLSCIEIMYGVLINTKKKINRRLAQERRTFNGTTKLIYINCLTFYDFEFYV